MFKKNWLAFALGLASIALAVVSLIVLPDTVITQFSVSGGGVTTMSKYLAVAIPTLLGIGGAVAALFAKDDKNSKQKRLVVSAVGIVVFIIMLVVNLGMAK